MEKDLSGQRLVPPVAGLQFEDCLPVHRFTANAQAVSPLIHTGDSSHRAAYGSKDPNTHARGCGHALGARDTLQDPSLSKFH